MRIILEVPDSTAAMTVSYLFDNEDATNHGGIYLSPYKIGCTVIDSDDMEAAKGGLIIDVTSRKHIVDNDDRK